MKRTIIKTGGIIILSLIIHLSSEAQHHLPKAVLIELNSYKNKTDYYIKNNQIRDADSVRVQTQKVMTCTVKDFKDNFNLCPVYFFVDTNLQKVINKQFKGVLFDSNMSILTDIPTSLQDSGYIIAYQGFDVQRGSKGLILFNYKHEEKFCIYKPEMSFQHKKYKKYICIFSKDYGIEYLPYAHELKKYLKD